MKIFGMEDLFPGLGLNSGPRDYEAGVRRIWPQRGVPQFLNIRSVGTATVQQAGRPRNQVSVPGRHNRFVSSP
jgi:hypothetical protein